MTPPIWLDSLRFDAAGLVPVVAQEALTGNDLMPTWANRTALEQTGATPRADCFSCSRQELWQKGATSGHLQYGPEIRVDCDADAVLYRVDQTGPACHSGAPSCFSLSIGPDGVTAEGDDPGGHLLTRLAGTIADRDRARPAGSCTTSLFERGLAKFSLKVGAEAVETVVAAHAESDERLASEATDLLFLEARKVPLCAVLDELERRER